MSDLTKADLIANTACATKYNRYPADKLRNKTKSQLRAEHAKATEEFLASGGSIQLVGYGESAAEGYVSTRELEYRKAREIAYKKLQQKKASEAKRLQGSL